MDGTDTFCESHFSSILTCTLAADSCQHSGLLERCTFVERMVSRALAASTTNGLAECRRKFLSTIPGRLSVPTQLRNRLCDAQLERIPRNKRRQTSHRWLVDALMRRFSAFNVQFIELILPVPMTLKPLLKPKKFCRKNSSFSVDFGL